ncbi:hypothetical protein QQ045_022253 [Rhodiola kirilowii]
MDISSRKRCREESLGLDISQPETKRMRLEADVEELSISSRSELDFPELVLLLDEPVEAVTTEDLDSVIRSFEEEILAPASEAQPELGFLFEASDDELGLPPPATDQSKAEVVDVDFSELLRFDDYFKSCDLFGFGDMVDDGEIVEDGFATFGDHDGLFGNKLVVERSELVYRPGSLPAS